MQHDSNPFAHFMLALRKKFSQPSGAISDESTTGSLKVWTIMGALSLALIFGGRLIENRYGFLAGFLLALSMNSWVFFYGDVRLSSLFSGLLLEGQDGWGLLSRIQTICVQIRMRRPSVVIVDSDTPLIFSAGLIPTRSTVFVSEALLNRLDETETRALLTAELLKLKSQQTASATAASALAGIVSYPAEALDSLLTLRFLPRSQSVAKKPVQTGPFTLVFAPLLALIIRFSLSRKNTFALDQETARLTNDKNALARALYKLDSYLAARPLAVNLAEAHLFSVSPINSNRYWSWLSPQPSAAERIKILTGFYPP